MIALASKMKYQILFRERKLTGNFSYYTLQESKDKAAKDHSQQFQRDLAPLVAELSISTPK